MRVMVRSWVATLVCLPLGLLGCGDSAGGGGGEAGGGAAGGQGGSSEGGGGADSEGGRLPASCFAGAHECDPRGAVGCEPGYACDVDFDGQRYSLSCFEPPNDVPLGGACNNHGGPYCEPGLGCGPDATCRTMCCDTSECTTAGDECVPLSSELGTLGVCIDPALVPECAAAGAACTTNDDCCSGDCHGDHCH